MPALVPLVRSAARPGGRVRGTGGAGRAARPRSTSSRFVGQSVRAGSSLPIVDSLSPVLGVYAHRGGRCACCRQNVDCELCSCHRRVKPPAAVLDGGMESSVNFGLRVSRWVVAFKRAGCLGACGTAAGGYRSLPVRGRASVAAPGRRRRCRRRRRVPVALPASAVRLALCPGVAAAALLDCSSAVILPLGDAAALGSGSRQRPGCSLGVPAAPAGLAHFVWRLVRIAAGTGRRDFSVLAVPCGSRSGRRVSPSSSTPGLPLRRSAARSFRRTRLCSPWCSVNCVRVRAAGAAAPVVCGVGGRRFGLSPLCRRGSRSPPPGSLMPACGDRPRPLPSGRSGFQAVRPAVRSGRSRRGIGLADLESAAGVSSIFLRVASGGAGARSPRVLLAALGRAPVQAFLRIRSCRTRSRCRAVFPCRLAAWVSGIASVDAPETLSRLDPLPRSLGFPWSSSARGASPSCSVHARSCSRIPSPVAALLDRSSAPLAARDAFAFSWASAAVVGRSQWSSLRFVPRCSRLLPLPRRSCPSFSMPPCRSSEQVVGGEADRFQRGAVSRLACWCSTALSMFQGRVLLGQSVADLGE